jgi:general secretion pathway protein G
MNEQSGPNVTPPLPVRAKTRWVFVLLVLVFAIIIVVGIAFPRIGNGGPRARSTAAAVQIANLGTAIDTFKVDNGYFPRGPNGLIDLMQRPFGATNWRGPYMEKPIPLDPWGHAYIYECPGRRNPQSYDLSSRSPDGQEIGNWKQK